MLISAHRAILKVRECDQIPRVGVVDENLVGLHALKELLNTPAVATRSLPTRESISIALAPNLVRVSRIPSGWIVENGHAPRPRPVST